MRRLLQLAAILLLVMGAMAHASIFKHKEGKHSESVEWLWQYGPPPPGGRETALVLDPRFRPLLAQSLTAPQTFWGNPKTGYKSLAETALDYLSVPDKVIADDNRYLSISGCVFRFNPARGLLWVDLGLPHPLVVFAAIDWVKEGKPSSDPDAEYTLWIFPDQAIDPAHIPEALTRSVARWIAEPYGGSTFVQKIRNTILVDPDGTPHPIPTVAIGANNSIQPQIQSRAEQKENQ